LAGSLTPLGTSTIASACAFGRKIVYFGGKKFVSAYVERDKKILKKWIFALTPLRI